MANTKAEGKRKRKRKSRTEVSSSPSPSPSPSSSDRETTPPASKKTAKSTTQEHQDTVSVAAATTSASPSPSASPFPEPAAERRVPLNEAFETFYLRQAAREFAEDLDKLRSASDFREGSSIGLLVGGLKQGVACFGEEERRRVGLGSG